MALLRPQLVNLCVLPDSSLFRVVLGGPRPATSVPKILLMCLSILIFPLTTVLFLTPIQNTDYTTTQGICQGNIKLWLRFLKKSRNTSLSGRKSVDYRTKHKNFSAGHRNFCATVSPLAVGRAQLVGDLNRASAAQSCWLPVRTESSHSGC